MLYWTMFYTVLLSFTPATWCLIVAPLLVAGALVLKERGNVAALGHDSVWRTLGQKWGMIGYCILAVALVAYLTDVGLAYYSTKYNMSFYDTLRERTSKISNVNTRKTLVRKAAERMDEVQVRDLANSYTSTLTPEQRLPFLNSFCSSEIDSDLIKLGPLFWAKSEANQGTANFAEDTTLPLDDAQRKLYESKDKAAFWINLRVEQWRYISKQLFANQSHEAMVDILANLVTELDAKESMRLAQEMLNSQFAGTRHLATRLASEANAPQLIWLFDVLVRTIHWLRGLLWLLIWMICGASIVSQASKMQSSPRLFPVNR